ncbi:hypothetical protein PHLCEN_2v2460 [Hermanssonia centrifuga]|uniref:Uncharacterized protein n=1 Tax=Hermanssonia centrifuga TaxID=98765 RepID=A0A2R6RLV9_9APHY|nr:hypothetical protein PHLCEN_2v2460 [Hermanssonia centrifuga]
MYSDENMYQYVQQGSSHVTSAKAVSNILPKHISKSDFRIEDVEPNEWWSAHNTDDESRTKSEAAFVEIKALVNNFQNTAIFDKRE